MRIIRTWLGGLLVFSYQLYITYFLIAGVQWWYQGNKESKPGWWGNSHLLLGICSFSYPVVIKCTTKLTCRGFPFSHAHHFLHVNIFVLQTEYKYTWIDCCFKHANGISLETALNLLSPNIKASLKSGVYMLRVMLIMSLCILEYSVFCLFWITVLIFLPLRSFRK